MNPRILTTEAVCWRVGGDEPISREKLRQLRKQYPELLKPVWRGRYSAEKVEKLIDILTGVESQSQQPDCHKIMLERMARRGEHKSAIPH
jgi:hypothetical protein